MGYRLEIYYEEDDYSKQYDIINGEVKLINDKFVYYRWY